MAERSQAVSAAAGRYSISFDQLIQLCCFLAERWADWNRDGRSLIADEYKRYLGQGVLMARNPG